MPPRYLFGPATPGFADRNLARDRETGACRCFAADAPADLQVRYHDT